MTSNHQINESNLLFILKLILPDTIVYNQFTLFTSQSPPAQVPTTSAATLIDPMKYFISPRTFLPLPKQDTSSPQLIYMNGGNQSL